MVHPGYDSRKVSSYFTWIFNVPRLRAVYTARERQKIPLSWPLRYGHGVSSNVFTRSSAKVFRVTINVYWKKQKGSSCDRLTPSRNGRSHWNLLNQIKGISRSLRCHWVKRMMLKIEISKTALKADWLAFLNIFRAWKDARNLVTDERLCMASIWTVRLSASHHRAREHIKRKEKHLSSLYISLSRKLSLELHFENFTKKHREHTKMSSSRAGKHGDYESYCTIGISFPWQNICKISTFKVLKAGRKQKSA